MKATQLEQMKEDYSYIMETKERTKEQINQGEEVCKHLMQLFFEISQILTPGKWYCKIIYRCYLYMCTYIKIVTFLCVFYLQGMY